ncbi:putative phage tail protein [Paenibacillus glacialis]|uniref:Phage portal protein n=1 Tax=Paenibacillus glacialis TaxID=494026 RepID=A0A168D4L0_9BACL|nr:putative phage tail protein [Paenibacillus glacialis]OAB33862.1 phage portal protein [Paenibacillus glacialis]
MTAVERLREHLPDYYDEIVEMDVLTATEGVEFDRLYSDIETLLNESYPETSTMFLGRYERDLQIVVDKTKPADQRRSVIISKMRGSGKVSGSMIKNVAQAYDGGTVNVAVDMPHYTIVITFIDSLGIPPNIDDLKQALEDIKPAHMALEYKFRFLLIREIHNVMTLNQIQQITLSNFSGGEAIA